MLSDGIRGAFDEAVAPGGCINVKALAYALDLPLSTMAPALGLTTRAIALDPTALKAQPRAAQLLMAMNELALHLTERRYAVSWLKTPNRTFGNQSAADWLKEGDLDGVCGHIGRLVVGQPD